MRRASDADFAWADVVMVSGMHVQTPQIHDIQGRATAAGKPTVLDGPPVPVLPGCGMIGLLLATTQAASAQTSVPPMGVPPAPMGAPAPAITQRKRAAAL